MEPRSIKAWVLALVLSALCWPAGAQTYPLNQLPAPINAALPVYDSGGNNKTPSHAVIDTCAMTLGSCTVTLSGGAAFSSATSYTCIPMDQSVTAILSTIQNVSGSSFTIHGTLSDTTRYLCIGW